MREEEIDTSQLSFTVQRGPPTAASGHAHLQIIKNGERVGEVLAGCRDVTVLGRNSRMAHEVLDHQSISRRHAALVHNGDGDVFAADLGSTHGTYVNGCKIPSKTATRLGDGDILKFGESSRSYKFRLSAPRSLTGDTPATIDGVALDEAPPATAGESHQANGAGPSGESNGSTPAAGRKAVSAMLPPPVKRVIKAGGKGLGGVWAQPKVPGGGRKPTAEGAAATASDAGSEEEAMLKANLPSTFGAARDKPLGKKADREAHIVRGGAGAVISGASGRFVTGRNGSGASNGKKAAVSLPDSSADKEEARRQRQAEIAAITAELARPDSGDAAEMTDGQTDGSESGSSPQFKPGGWRHAAGNGKGSSMGSAGRKKSQRTGGVTGRSRAEEEEEEEEEEVEEEEEEEEMTEEMRIKLVVRRLGLPVSHEVQLSGHHKGVTALALDRAGGRVATGSNDYKVKLFDFGGMDKRHLPFREIEPEEGNVVVSISYSGTGHAFLVCTAGSQPKVYDRDGNQIAHFVKGDPYLKNMASTKGHVTRVTGGDWHPTKRNEMLTCSVDGTVRLWNLTGKKSFDNLMCQTVIKLRSANALKLGCTAAVYHQEGRRVAAGGEDGSLHLIQLDRPYARHEVVREAHNKGCGLTSISFNEDGHLLATRAMDDTVKLWDIRKLGGGVVKTFTDVPTHLETANTSFSPDGRVLVCGSNVPPKTNAVGVLKFFDVFTAETSPELEVNAAPDASVARVIWHPQTNQIICSTSVGGVRVMYDPAISDKGAMLSAGRSHSRLNTNMFLPKHAVGEVYAPHALPMFREEQNSKKRKERSDRKDPVRSKKPDPPMPGRGVQGRISSSNNFHQYVLKEHLVSQKNLLHEDPRLELLKYDEETKKDKEFLGSAYEQSQPEGGGMYHRTLEEEAEDFKEEQRKLLDS